MNSILLQAFGCLYLGLDASGVILCSAGSAADLPETLPEGLTWQEFAASYAQHRAGLEQGWMAIAQGRVAPEYWPDLLPFREPLVVRLRPVTGDSEIAYAAQIMPRAETALNALCKDQILPLIEQAIRLGQHMSLGVDGPLTDPQVRRIESMLTDAEQVRSLLEQARMSQLTASTTAPEPLALPKLLTFSSQDFLDRRVVTHRLGIKVEFSPAVVYCYAHLRDIIQRILRILLISITAETEIRLSDQLADDGRAIRVSISYQCAADQSPIPLPIVQACLAPVHGRAWIETYTDQGNNSRLVLILPRWLES